MSDFVSPAASPIALPAKAAPPSLLAPGVPSLAAFLDLMIGKIVLPGTTAKSGDAARQDDAATGNSLPDEDKTVDPALAWLFGAPPIPSAQPNPLACNVEPGTPTVSAVPIVPAPKADTSIPSPNTPQIEVPQPQVSPATLPNKPDVAPKPIDPNFLIGPVAPLPVVSPVAVALPALFALGHATEARDDDTPLPGTPAVAPSQPTLPVAATADPQRQSLDMGNRDWPQKMIDHIETLRDNANANDTSIRLKPDALGRVDVSLKNHADGAVSVRFTAEQPTTRTLLIDAAPQLTAAAEARGIRLSGTSVDLSGQGDQRPRPEVERQQNITNHLAAPRGEDSAVDDGRIA